MVGVFVCDVLLLLLLLLLLVEIFPTSSSVDGLIEISVFIPTFVNLFVFHDSLEQSMHRDVVCSDGSGLPASFSSFSSKQENKGR